MHFDASYSRRLLKTLWQKKDNGHYTDQLFSFATMFSTLFNNSYILFFVECPYFCLEVFKVICCRHFVLSILVVNIYLQCTYKSELFALKLESFIHTPFIIWLPEVHVVLHVFSSPGDLLSKQLLEYAKQEKDQPHYQ